MSETHKRTKAIALSYDDQKEQAPRVAATGSGLIADQILERAEAAGVPIQEDPNLVELLSTLDINQNIPEELYQAVAEVFAFIYHVDKQTDLIDKNKKDRQT